MRNAVLHRDLLAAALLCAGWVGVGTCAETSRLDVSVSDEDASAVAGIVVYAVPLDGQAETRTHDATAVMDQVNRRFIPHILVVETGTRINFPNHDSVSHHVYSFSAGYHFELPLYKGSVYPPLAFDKPGVVVVGCNIHDNMLGYILVVDTPYFMMTDAHGVASFDGLPAGHYSVGVWTPRLRPNALPEPVRVPLSSTAKVLAFRFTERLFPPHDERESTLKWHDY